MADPPHPAPEAALVRALLAGDPGALDRWYRAEFPAVWRLALGVLLDGVEAEDLAQEAMLKLHDRLAAWDSARPYRPWRNTLVLNLCRDRLRRRAARRRAEGEAAERERPSSSEPSAALEQGETRELLELALGTLSPREREAFVLRELEGCSSEEAAAAMEIEVGSLRSLLTLARRRLRSFLERRVPELAGGEDA